MFLELPNFSNKLKNDSNSNCRVIVINWFANYIQNKPNQYSYNITLVSKFMGYVNFQVNLFHLDNN